MKNRTKKHTCKNCKFYVDDDCNDFCSKDRTKIECFDPMEGESLITVGKFLLCQDENKEGDCPFYKFSLKTFIFGAPERD